MNNNRRVLFSILVLALVACLILALLALSGVITLGLGQPSTSGLPTANVTQSVIRITAAVSTPSGPTKTPRPTQVVQPVPSNVSQQMDSIEKNVVELRKIQPKSPVNRGLLTGEQLRQRMVDDYTSDYSDEQAQKDVRRLAAFGLVNPDLDIRQMMIDVMSEQVAGFYDPDSQEMYVIQGKSFGATERLTYAHEYTHALQDQNYDLSASIVNDSEQCNQKDDRCQAYLALVEGDATYIMQNYMLRYASRQDLLDIQREGGALETPVLDAAPPFLQSDLMFAYLEGMRFVQTAAGNGYANIDQLFANPPISTEQILHPERYPNDIPLELALPDLSSVLGAEWQLLDTDTLGEWGMRLVLTAGINEDAQFGALTVRPATEGWGGDRYTLYDRQGATVLVWLTRWDTAKDASEFWTLLQEYGKARWGAPAAESVNRIDFLSNAYLTSFHISGDRVLWVMAPDETLRNALMDRVLP